MGDLGDISAEYSELLLHHRQKKSPCTVVTAPQEACEEGEGAGVLLYYKYVDLGEDRRSAVKGWYLRHCGAEGLRGRVRVALDGVNCTLGGSLAALGRHIDSVKADTILQGGDIDFKLSASRGARNSQAALESGFTTLSVRAVKEVVSLGVQGGGLSHLNGGRHVSPQEFHRLLQEEATRRRRRRPTRFSGGGDGGGGSEGAPSVQESDAPAAAAAAVGHRRSGSGTPPVAVVCQADPPARKPQEQRDGDRAPTEEAVLPSESWGQDMESVADLKGGGGGGGGGGGNGQGNMDEAGKVDAAAGPSSSTLSNEKEAVLLDVRNVYETSIGHFSAEGVERLDPKTRQFSELPKWVDENVERLRGKRVLMYCTGGVRCELASALIRRHCDADATGTEVLQLSGGIERYLQAYPSHGEDPPATRGGGDGDAALGAGEHQQAPHSGTAGDGTVGGGAEEGFFRGKNFVFDERVSVPETPAGGKAIGRCLMCESPWDDYGSRSRCTRCRMLVLVCDACVVLLEGGNHPGGGNGDARGAGRRRREALQRPAPTQRTPPNPPTEKGNVSARRPPRTTPPDHSLGAEASAAGAVAAAPPASSSSSSSSSRGDREGGVAVDRGKGGGGALAAAELVCPACRLRGQ